MDMECGYVLAMYDVRGIQKYIFRTPDLKSAIGASALVEDIIEQALKESLSRYEKQTGITLTKDLEWYDEGTGPKSYKEDSYDVQVLYIGGGNAFVVYRDICASGIHANGGQEKDSSCKLASAINQRMAKYVLENTYSLQLAVAMVEKTADYPADQLKVRQKMEQVKRSMSAASPFGATPAVKVDVRTGYPLIFHKGKEDLSTEALNKKAAAERKRWYYLEDEKKIDSLRTKKGIDSTVAVIHIDGNNLGLRIRSLLEGKTTYQEGVTAQRQISYRINHSYKTAFEKMKQETEEVGRTSRQLAMKEKDIFIIPVVTAGDDITYVCNGRLALKSVDFFVKEISGYSMADNHAGQPDSRYSFSICAGIAFANSHFPFHIAYDVAEECCENAKKTAKSRENLQDGQIGNWVDFHICKNIQARNLKVLREKEYVTSLGDQLLLRPYYISNGHEDNDTVFGKLASGVRSLENLENSIIFFVNTDNIPRSYAKQLRNTYTMGKYEVQHLSTFLQSRGHRMPDQSYNMYERDHARWYDALEMMDLFASL